MRIPSTRLILAALFASSLAACGNKGPLVLPDKADDAKKSAQPVDSKPGVVAPSEATATP